MMRLFTGCRLLLIVSMLAIFAGCSTDAPAGGDAAPATENPATAAERSATENAPATSATKNSTPESSPTAPAAAADPNDLGALPVPRDSSPVFVGADVAMYATTGAVDATKETCRKLLIEKGWVPYGTAGDVQFFKKDLVRVTANISAAPGQNGKTMISYSKEPISVDLPAPLDAVGLQYSDSTKQLHFDTDATRDEVVEYYKTTLAQQQWKPTTERPLEVGFKREMIFRNPGKDMLTLEISEVDEHRRVNLRHQSAEQVAEGERRAKAELARREAERNKPLPKLTLDVPASAAGLDSAANRLAFQLPSGEAIGVVEGWRAKLAADGWADKRLTDDPKVGSYSFDRDGQSLSIQYTDIGLIPAEITVIATGVELVPNAKK